MLCVLCWLSLVLLLLSVYLSVVCFLLASVQASYVVSGLGVAAVRLLPQLLSTFGLRLFSDVWLRPIL